MGPGGEVFASQGTDAVFRIDTDDSIHMIIDFSGDGSGNFLDNIADLEVDAGGNVYVAGATSDNVFQIVPGGTVTEILDPTGDGLGNLFDNPADLAVTPTGIVYANSTGTDGVFRVLGGVANLVAGPSGDGSNSLEGSYGLTLDASDSLYVTCRDTDNVFRVTPGGVVTEIIGPAGDGTNPLETPTGPAIADDGTVYVGGGLTDNVFLIPPPELFADGFETGDTSRWSLRSP